MELAKAFVTVRADTRDFDRDLEQVERKSENSARSSAANWARAFAGVALTAGIKRSIDAASRLEQAVGGTATVFGDARREVDAFAESSAEGFGISNSAARELTSQIGGLLQGMGFTQDEAAKTSVSLAKLGADLAAAFGGNPEEAVGALGAALRGEMDPLERFGVSLNQTQVNLKAVDMGLAASTSSVDANAKAQATLALIAERTATVQGQSAREANTAAGEQARAAAKAEDAAASLGQNFLPVYAKVVDVVGKAAEAFGALPGPVQTGIVALAGVAVVAPKVSDGLTLIRSGLSRVSSGTQTAVGRLGGLKGALGALGIVGAVAGLAALASQTGKTTVNVDELARATANLSEAEAEQLQQHLRVLSAWGDLDDVVRQTAESNVVAADRLLEQAEAAGIAGDELQRLKDIVDAKRESDVQGRKDQDAYANEMNKATGSASRLTKEVDDQTSAYDRNRKALDELTDALYGSFDANIGYRRSLDDTEDALESLIELQKEGKSGTEEWDRALLDAESTLLDQAEAAARMAEQQAKANGRTFEAADRNRAYRAELVKLRDGLAPGSPLRAALDGYIAKLDALPTQVRTVVDADLSPAERKLREFMEQSRTVRIQAQLDNPYVRTGGAQLGRQLGGPVQAGDRVRVGEAGPEEVVFGQAGTVIPNHELGRGGMGAGTYIAELHVHTDRPAKEWIDEAPWRSLTR